MRALLAGFLLCGVAACVAIPAHATSPGKNGQIAYQHVGKNLFVINADGTGDRKLTEPTGAEDDDPDWSPNGSAIAFNRCAQYCQIWRINADGTGLKRLGPSCPPTCDVRGLPAWSPSGKAIALGRQWGPVENDQIKFSEIFVMNAGGGGLRQVTHITTANPFSADVGGSMWSPNGKQIVFVVHNSSLADPAGGSALFIIDADGSALHQLTPWELNAGGVRPDWSPDGRLILFRVPVGTKEHRGDIYTIHPDGTGLERLTHYGPNKAVDNPSFSPDGKWITFSRFSTKGPYPDVFAMHLNGAGVHQVTRTGVNYAPDWGPAH